MGFVRRSALTALLLSALTVLTSAALGPAAIARADSIRDNQWHLTSLNVSEAHQRSKGEGVTVAIVDVGVDATHVDLAANVLPPVAVNGDTGNIRVDPDGHGTALAGLIAGQGHGANRENGVLGVAPAARILPVVIRGDAGPNPAGRTVTADLLAAGLELAAKRGATVIVVGYSVAGSPRLEQAVAAARRADAVVVAADGNRQGESVEGFPAGYDGVLAAVPLGRDGSVTVNSPSGRRLGIGVPGVEIMTTNTGGGYRVDAGSASAGILAAAVALVRSAYPRLRADEIVHRLASTAIDGGPSGPDAEHGRGRLDLVAAVTRTVAPLSPPTASPAASASVSASPSAGAASRPPRQRGAFGWLLALPLMAVLGVLAGRAWRAEREPGSAVQNQKAAKGS